MTLQLTVSRSRSVDINNSGQVIFSNSDVDDNGYVYFWDAGSTTLLPGLNPSGYGTPEALNDLGHVVGVSRSLVDYNLHAVLWHDGVVQDLNADGFLARPAAINNQGQIVGYSLLWDSGNVIDFNMTPYDLYALTLNESGQIVGGAYSVDTFEYEFGFLWHSGTLTSLLHLCGPGDLGGYTINNCGEMLGSFLYESAHPCLEYKLSISVDSGWSHLSVANMNDRGQMTGYGLYQNEYRAFLMSPLPGDVAWDGVVDLIDFSIFQSEFTGPLEPAVPGCNRADIDGDADVDGADYVLFQEGLTGPRK